MLFLRRTLPLALAFILGITGIFVFYVPHSTSQLIETELALWDRIIWAFAMLLGIYSLLKLHLGRVRKQQAGWGYSFLVFFGFLFRFGGAGGATSDCG